MRITGTFSYIDHDLNDETWALVIKVADAEAVKHASNLLCATVDIYPHPVDGLRLGECTPENYAHALARLAHAEDHLAREVRSSQALLDEYRTNRELHVQLVEARDRVVANLTTENAELKVVIDSLNAALFRGDSELSDNEDGGRR